MAVSITETRLRVEGGGSITIEQAGVQGPPGQDAVSADEVTTISMLTENGSPAEVGVSDLHSRADHDHGSPAHDVFVHVTGLGLATTSYADGIGEAAAAYADGAATDAAAAAQEAAEAYADNAATTAAGSALSEATAYADEVGEDAVDAAAIAAAATYVPLSSKGQANGVASLGAGGTIPTDQLPALAITDSHVVASEAAMLALTAEPGDIAIRTDVSTSFVLAASPASTLANWKQLLAPPAPVTSVDAMTGDVDLSTSYADIAHDHDLDYAVVAHDHDLTYAELAHNHDGSYEDAGAVAAHTGDANAHHNQAHALTGGDHTASGLTTGHVLTALSATTFGFAAPVIGGILDRSSWTTPGTYTTAWTKPAGARFVKVEVVGGGGGGGSGRRGAAGTVRGGGGSGGGAQYSVAVFDADDLPSTLTVVVGGGGAGGAERTADNTDGATGGQGGRSYVGASVSAAIIIASGGNAGTGGTGSAGGTGGARRTEAGLYIGGPGRNGATSGNGAYFIPTWDQGILLIAGGGGGGGITAADVPGEGGDGGPPITAGTIVALPSNGIPGANGKVMGGGGAWSISAGVFGGAGGDARVNTASGQGGDGVFGSGGGGGGASANGYVAGRGGNGGDGAVLITTVA